MDYGKEFKKFATQHQGINSMYYDKLVSSVTPYIIEERQLNVAQMDVFSRLMMDRIIFLGTAIDDYVANIIQAQLLFLESVDNSKDISIYINSPGGGVYAGLGIYDTMQFIKPEVATICTGMAASMGSIILSQGAKGKRSILPNAEVMIHQPWGGAQGQASDIEITARHILKTRDTLNKMLAKASGKKLADIQKKEDEILFQSLIGLPEGIDIEEYNDDDDLVSFFPKCRDTSTCCLESSNGEPVRGLLKYIYIYKLRSCVFVQYL